MSVLASRGDGFTVEDLAWFADWGDQVALLDGVVQVTPPSGQPFTVEDLDTFPENDPNRFELIGGILHVTPSPVKPHQRALRNLFRVLDRACPPELEVWFAPLDVEFTRDTVLQPDAFVVVRDDPDGRRVTSVPLLAVEVLSPSTRRYDLVHKREAYRQAGVGTYVIVDPVEPSIRAWVWADGDETVIEATDDEPLQLDSPFPVRLVASELIAPSPPGP